jgi:tetratricopeptide (TPR) repeat protein
MRIRFLKALPLATAMFSAALAVAAGRGEPASTTPDAAKGSELPRRPAPLIERLGHPSAPVRDAALEALVALGEKAVPALEQARDHPDAETRWRVREALHRIRWRIGPTLAKRIADLMHGFEAQPRGRRELICRDLAMVGRGAAVTTLTRILKDDPSQAVRHAAARALVMLGDEGLAALLDAGVDTEGLNLYTVSVRIHLGNSFLEKGKLEKALEQYRLGLEAEPTNSIAHYNIGCTYARMGKNADALDALERAVDHGYRDADWMRKDSDLETLREEPRFKTLLERIRQLNAGDVE